MFKLVVLLVAASAVCAISVDDAWQRSQTQMRTMANKIREVSTEVADSIQNVQADTNQGRRIVLEQSNEFAHNIQNVVYEMQQDVQNIQGEDKKTLQQIAQRLSEVAYNVQQAMNSEPNQMKLKLKEEVQKVATEVEKLTQHLEGIQKPQGEQTEHMKAMIRVMMDLHVTVKKLEIQIRNNDKTTQDLYNKMKEVATQINTFTQNIQDDDEQAVQYLTNFVQRICQHMNNMVDRLEREANDQQGQIKQRMQLVANKMSEMRTDLEKATLTHGNTQEKGRKIKEELNKTMRNAAEEVQRLIQVVQQSNEQGKFVVKNVMVDGVAVVETTQAQLRMMFQKN